LGSADEKLLVEKEPGKHREEEEEEVPAVMQTGDITKTVNWKSYFMKVHRLILKFLNCFFAAKLQYVQVRSSVILYTDDNKGLNYCETNMTNVSNVQ